MNAYLHMAEEPFLVLLVASQVASWAVAAELAAYTVATVVLVAVEALAELERSWGSEHFSGDLPSSRDQNVETRMWTPSE